MTFRTLSESISTEEDQQKLREEARRRRALRYNTRFNCIATNHGNNHVYETSTEDVSTCGDEKESKEDSDGILIHGKLNVTFADIRIKEYILCLGDNPGGKAGPPISLSWNTITPEESIIPLDEYEKNRGVESRKMGIALILPPEDRIRVLRNLGYTDVQMKAVTKKMATIRAQRRDTYAALAFGEDCVMAIDSFKQLFRRERNRKIECNDSDHDEDNNTNRTSLTPWINCTGGSMMSSSTTTINHSD